MMFPRTILIFSCLVATGCGGSRIEPVAGGSMPVDAHVGSAVADTAVFFPPTSPPLLPDAAPAPDGGNAVIGGASCAEEAHMAERAPVDLLLLLDRSGSMSELAPNNRSKWAMAQDALTAFIKDPASAGLGVGMSFFPSVAGMECTTVKDCSQIQIPIFAQACIEARSCVAPGGGVGARCGGMFDLGCPAGTMCQPVGRCAIGGAYCSPVGQPCPGGDPKNTCTKAPNVCEIDFDGSCKAQDFMTPAVPIADLPGAQASLVNTLAAMSPGGQTPTLPAVQGSVSQLQMRAAAQPGRREVLVLVTDGTPSPCGGAPMAVPAVTMAIAAARAMTPPITTYVIGVFGVGDLATGQMAVTSWAMAGGTDAPVVLAPGSDLSQKLLDALGKIRGAAVACAYAIPAARAGGAIDYQMVNLHYKGTSGEQDVGYVGTADRCDPTRGGWYYDVDPVKGTPTRILVCDATCRLFSADPSARVELRFGCKTRVIQ